MRQNIKSFIKNCSELIPISEPIYEFGSMQVEGQEDFADLRPFFKGKEYVGCDYRDGLGVDKVIDVHNINLPNSSVGTIICCDTLEHVKNPILAISEFKRILKPDGIIIISSVMNFQIHSYPYDYWRFTPECFKSLLEYFKFVDVQSAGYKNFPHTVVGIASNFSFQRVKLQQDSKYKKYIDLLIPKIITNLFN